MLERLFAMTYHYRANRSYLRGEYQRCLHLYTKSLCYMADNVLALVNRSIVYQQLGEHSRAVADLDRVIELKPKFGVAYFNRGVSAKLLGDLNQAVADQSRTIALNPKDAGAYGELGVLHLLKLEWEPAIINFTQAIKLDPADASHLSNRGFVQFFRAEFEMAAADLERSLRKSLDPYALLFCYLAQARKERDGIEQLKNAARVLDLTKWPNTLIGLFLGSIDPDALLAQAREDKQKGEAQFYIGQWHMLENAYPKAAAAFKEAARLCPPPFVERAGAIAELDRLSHLPQGTEHAQASITARNARDES